MWQLSSVPTSLHKLKNHPVHSFPPIFNQFILNAIRSGSLIIPQVRNNSVNLFFLDLFNDPPNTIILLPHFPCPLCLSILTQLFHRIRVQSVNRLTWYARFLLKFIPDISLLNFPLLHRLHPHLSPYFPLNLFYFESQYSDLICDSQ